MLSDVELDSIDIGGIGFMGPYTFSQLIAQAKLANELQLKLAKARSDALEVVDCFNYLSGKCRCQWSGITLEEVKRATKEKP